MSAAAIRARLAQVREEIWLRKCSDDRAFTGPRRDILRRLLAEEVTLSGLLRRMARQRRGDCEPDQLEFAFT